MATDTDRFQRQATMVPREKLSKLNIAVIGLGAGGRTTALELAAIGATNLHLVDHDVVELVNTTTQGYSKKDIGRYKVDALASSILADYPDVIVHKYNTRWRPNLMGDKHPEIIFCCVDSIATREYIWKKSEDMHRFYVDGRMLAFSIKVLVAYDNRTRAYYSKTLFPESEAEGGSCTARSAIWPAKTAASMAVNAFVLWLNDINPPVEFKANLMTYEFDVIDLDLTDKAKKNKKVK